MICSVFFVSPKHRITERQMIDADSNELLLDKGRKPSSLLLPADGASWQDVCRRLTVIAPHIRYAGDKSTKISGWLWGEIVADINRTEAKSAIIMGAKPRTFRALTKAEFLKSEPETPDGINAVQNAFVLHGIVSREQWCILEWHTPRRPAVIATSDFSPLVFEIDFAFDGTEPFTALRLMSRHFRNIPMCITDGKNYQVMTAGDVEYSGNGDKFSIRFDDGCFTSITQ